MCVCVSTVILHYLRCSSMLGFAQCSKGLTIDFDHDKRSKRSRAIEQLVAHAHDPEPHCCAQNGQTRAKFFPVLMLGNTYANPSPLPIDTPKTF